MTTFRNYIAANFGLELPNGDIPASWFIENGLPMIVHCTCCGSTMASPCAWIDREGYTYCGSCVGEEDD